MARLQRWLLAACFALTLFCAVVVSVTIALAQMSPSSVIAYTFDTNGRADIYLLDLQRGYHVNMTRTPETSELRPVWSPDGMALLYNHVSFEQSLFQVCVWQLGQHRRCFDTPDLSLYNPMWSPESNTLLLYSAMSTDRHLTLLDIATGELRPLNAVTAQVQRETSWSPDGSQIAFTRDTGEGMATFSIVRLDSGAVLHPVPDTLTEVLKLAWSPDSRYIAHIFNDGSDHVAVFDVENGGVRDLTDVQGSYQSVDWLPDGTQLLVVGAQGMDDFDLYLVDVTDGQWQALTDNTALDEFPSMSPDGQQLVFTSNRDGDVHVYAMNADGSNVRRLTFAEGRNTAPAWRP